MKKIEPVSVWQNGKSQQADILIASISYDDLHSACSFQYELCQSIEGTEEEPLVINAVLVNGFVSMSKEAYQEWDGNSEYAYSYIAEQLNLTLI
jgi:hypothetical protein